MNDTTKDVQGNIEKHLDEAENLEKAKKMEETKKAEYSKSDLMKMCKAGKSDAEMHEYLIEKGYESFDERKEFIKKAKHSMELAKAKEEEMAKEKAKDEPKAKVEIEIESGDDDDEDMEDEKAMKKSILQGLNLVLENNVALAQSVEELKKSYTEQIDSLKSEIAELKGSQESRELELKKSFDNTTLVIEKLDSLEKSFANAVMESNEVIKDNKTQFELIERALSKPSAKVSVSAIDSPNDVETHKKELQKSYSYATGLKKDSIAKAFSEVAPEKKIMAESFQPVDRMGLSKNQIQSLVEKGILTENK